MRGSRRSGNTGLLVTVADVQLRPRAEQIIPESAAGHRGGLDAPSSGLGCRGLGEARSKGERPGLCRWRGVKSAQCCVVCLSWAGTRKGSGGRGECFCHWLGGCEIGTTVCVCARVCVGVCALRRLDRDGESRRAEDARVGNRRRRTRAMFVLAGHGGRGRRPGHGGRLGCNVSSGVGRGVAVAGLGMSMPAIRRSAVAAVPLLSLLLGSGVAAMQDARCTMDALQRRREARAVSQGHSTVQAQAQAQIARMASSPGWQRQNQSRWGVALSGSLGGLAAGWSRSGGAPSASALPLLH
jgi:hypothetical protein